MKRIPSLKEIHSMTEVTDWKGRTGHRVFIGEVGGEKAKFTIEHRLGEAFVLEKLSNAVLRSNPGINLQLVVGRRGKITRQNYFYGKEIGKNEKFAPRQIRQLIFVLARLHNSRIPFYLKPFAKRNFLHRVNKSIKKLVQSGLFTEKEIALFKSFFSQVPKGTSAICHNDLHAGNLLKQKNGEVVLIDFGDAKVGFKEGEIGRMIINFGWDKKQVEEFLELYKKAGGNISLFEANENYWVAFGLLNKIRSLSKKVGGPSGKKI
jgi:thiamine kinase-like enzyme